MMSKYTLKTSLKRNYHRDSTMSKSEVMLIMILFHDSVYRCLKHFNLEAVCKNMRHLFPHVVSYNRFVELEHDVAIPLALFIKKVLLGKCTGISFVDSTPLRVCRNQRIHNHKHLIWNWHLHHQYGIGNNEATKNTTSPIAGDVVIIVVIEVSRSLHFLWDYFAIFLPFRIYTPLTPRPSILRPDKS